MGWNTYYQIVTELSVDNWVYDDLTSYVITHRQNKSTDKIYFESGVCSLIKCLKQQDGKDIWICGGASIVNQLIKANLIDCFHLSIIPTLLGQGTRLFENFNQEIKLQLIATFSYNGITDLIYKIK